MKAPMPIIKIIKIFILTLFVPIYANNDSFIASTSPHLHEKFDMFSDIEVIIDGGLLHSTAYNFNTQYDAHLGSIIAILFITFLLIVGFIGTNSDRPIGISDTGYNLEMSEKKKNEIDSRPIGLIQAIIVFILATLLIKYIHKDDVNRVVNFDKQILKILDRDKNVIEEYSLKDANAIEILKYSDNEYLHYELNIQLKSRRYNLYANSDDISINCYASILSQRLNKPIVKIETGF